MQTAHNSGVVPTELTCRILKAHLLAIYDIWNAHSSVLRLMAFRYQDYVRRIIIAVIVPAFYGQVRGNFSKVLKEFFKRLPLFANRNASASIVLVSLAGWVLTTLMHVSPRSVCLAGFVPSCVAVSDFSMVKACAGYDLSGHQVRIANDFFCSAFAAAKALTIPAPSGADVIRSIGNNFHLTEDATYKGDFDLEWHKQQYDYDL